LVIVSGEAGFPELPTPVRRRLSSEDFGYPPWAGGRRGGDTLGSFDDPIARSPFCAFEPPKASFFNPSPFTGSGSCHSPLPPHFFSPKISLDYPHGTCPLLLALSRLQPDEVSVTRDILFSGASPNPRAGRTLLRSCPRSFRRPRKYPPRGFISPIMPRRS